MQKYSSEIKKLSHQQLLSQIKLLVQKERNTHIQVLHHLKEIDSRKLYLELGFSSLFDYAVKELNYSEGAAYRRIKAMKLCRDLPDTEDRLQSGKLSLSSASQLQAFFEKQAKRIKTENSKKKENKKTDGISKIAQNNFTIPQQGCSVEDQKGNESSLFLNVEEKQGLVKRAEGCSTRATMKLLLEADPSLSVSKEQARFLGNGKVEIKFVIDESCYKKLEELKSFLSHKSPILSHRELLSILLEEALEKHDPRRKKVRKTRMNKETITSSQKWESKNINNKQGHKNKAQQPIVTSAQKLRLQQVNGLAATFRQKREYGSKAKQINRAIPSHLRKHIWERDEGQCTYVNSKTRRKCSSKHLLQIDHIRPFSLGGKSEASNLRLLCAGHNQLRSEKDLWKKNQSYFSGLISAFFFSLSSLSSLSSLFSLFSLFSLSSDS